MEDWSTELRERLEARIRENASGTARMKIKTLLWDFGYQASQRVRQSSLEQVIARLGEWGISARFPGGQQAHDWVTLGKGSPAQAAGPSEVDREPPDDAAHSASPIHRRLRADACVDPFAFVFQVDDYLDPRKSEARARDMLAAVWSGMPCCLLVDGSDEYFSFAAGYLAAVMRRRALMMRRGDTEGAWLPLAPTVLAGTDLQSLRGEGEPRLHEFPVPGGVYLIKDDPQDLQDDELAAFLREAAIPHTYRVAARFDATSPRDGVGPERTAMLHNEWANVRMWFACYAGTPTSVGLIGTADRATDVVLGSLLAAAEQARHTLLHQIALARTDPGFKGGWESGEHLLLKSALTTALRARYGERLQVEARVDALDDEERWDEAEAATKATKRPDLYVAREVWIEVETLRGVGRRGSDPFFGLETKLRGKLKPMNECKQKWLVVPSDVAMLARDQIGSVARNLADDLELAFWDAGRGHLVVLPPREALPAEISLSGAPWTTPRQEKPKAQKTWADVAGYRDLKQTLRGDLLEPFVQAQRYADHGIEPPAGLLLYGLPGCGKSLIGRVLAGESEVECRVVIPSDLTSEWVGAGVRKIRELFDWARKRAPCVLEIDEIDGIAPVRREQNMHSDEKRQVNELLAQLDKLADDRVLVVATTNYVRGVDPAIRRAGRFDHKIAVFPPGREDRAEILKYYLGRLRGFDGLETIDEAAIAAETLLYTPADLRAVVHVAARRALVEAGPSGRARLRTEQLRAAVAQHSRAIRPDHAREWLDEAKLELPSEDAELRSFEAELEEVYAAAAS